MRKSVSFIGFKRKKPFLFRFLHPFLSRVQETEIMVRRRAIWINRYSFLEVLFGKIRLAPQSISISETRIDQIVIWVHAIRNFIFPECVIKTIFICISDAEGIACACKTWRRSYGLLPKRNFTAK